MWPLVNRKLLRVIFIVNLVMILNSICLAQKDNLLKISKIEKTVDSLILIQTETTEKFNDKLLNKIDETERKLEISKSLVDFKDDSINKWLSILGILVAIFGVGFPLFGFFYGKKLREDLEKEQKDLSANLKEFKNEYKEELNKLIKDSKENLLNFENEALIRVESIKGKEEFGNKILSNLEKIFSKGVGMQLSETEKIKLEVDVEKLKNDESANPYVKDLAIAVSLYYSDEYDKAIQKFNKLLTDYKNEITIIKAIDIFTYLGYSYQKLRLLDESINFF